MTSHCLPTRPEALGAADWEQQPSTGEAGDVLGEASNAFDQRSRLGSTSQRSSGFLWCHWPSSCFSAKWKQKIHPLLVYLLNPFGSGSQFALGFAPCLSRFRAGDPGVTAAGQNRGNNNNCAVLAQEGGRLFSAFAAHNCWYKWQIQSGLGVFLTFICLGKGVSRCSQPLWRTEAKDLGRWGREWEKCIELPSKEMCIIPRNALCQSQRSYWECSLFSGQHISFAKGTTGVLRGFFQSPAAVST